ncbi:hypothetical protein HOLleu_21392 [Holothuria leucospilota]|uniref:HYR domain-containing protein n=1 Tax=Holothuria leucospilota TaxID=206669 RepID=A0A9Q1H6S4_HOLLE|nr:hypothetical protein HOLleu_21392 [Holothuria leucospilota]
MCLKNSNRSISPFVFFTIQLQTHNQPPNCPNTETNLSALRGTQTTIATYGPFFCSDVEQSSILATCNPVSGSPFNIGGNNVVSRTCTESGDLANSCNFLVSQLDPDTGPLVPACPSFPFMISASVGSNSAVADYGVILCADLQEGSIAAICQPAAGSLFSIGSNVVRCTCVDNGNLTSNCVFNVIVQESSENFPIWFVLVPSAAFIIGMLLLVSVILVLKRPKARERRRSDDTLMEAVTNTSHSTVMEEMSYTDVKIKPQCSSHEGGIQHTGSLHENGTPGYTTSIQPSGELYSRNIYKGDDPYHAIE